MLRTCCRVPFGLSYLVLAWVGYCLYQHYKSYALMRLLHVRTTVPAGRGGLGAAWPIASQQLGIRGLLAAWVHGCHAAAKIVHHRQLVRMASNTACRMPVGTT